MNENAWCTHIKKQVDAWHKEYKHDSGVFEYCRPFIKDLIDARGDLQLLQLKKNGFEDVSDLKQAFRDRLVSAPPL